MGCDGILHGGQARLWDVDNLQYGGGGGMSVAQCCAWLMNTGISPQTITRRSGDAQATTDAS
jgi:hypothetical protein